MGKTFWIIPILFALSGTPVAHADSVLVFDASGTFADQFGGGTSTLTGTVTIDTTMGTVTAADLTTTGPLALGPFSIGKQAVVSGGFYDANLNDGSGDIIELLFPTNTLSGYAGGSLCGQTPLNCVTVVSALDTAAAPFNILNAGSLTAVPTPEPSTLAFLCSGFSGLIAVAFRRKRAG